MEKKGLIVIAVPIAIVLAFAAVILYNTQSNVPDDGESNGLPDGQDNEQPSNGQPDGGGVTGQLRELPAYIEPESLRGKIEISSQHLISQEELKVVISGDLGDLLVDLYGYKVRISYKDEDGVEWCSQPRLLGDFSNESGSLIHIFNIPEVMPADVFLDQYRIALLHRNTSLNDVWEYL